MLIIMGITLIDKCHKGFSDLVGNPSRISQNEALISWAVTAQLTTALFSHIYCTADNIFVFTYVESRFSHDVTRITALSRRSDTNEKGPF